MTSAESDFLLSLAALSLSFAGFSAVVVTLRGALGGEISDRHLRLVRLYIEGGLLVTALALLPTLLNLLHISDVPHLACVQRSRCVDLHRPAADPVSPSPRGRGGPLPAMGRHHLRDFARRRCRSLAQFCGDSLSAERRPLRCCTDVGTVRLWFHLCAHYRHLSQPRTYLKRSEAIAVVCRARLPSQDGRGGCNYDAAPASFRAAP